MTYSRYLTEYDKENELQLAREEAYMIAYAEGVAEIYAKLFAESPQEFSECVASILLRKNIPISLISQHSGLADKAIIELAKSLGVAVVF